MEGAGCPTALVAIRRTRRTAAFRSIERPQRAATGNADSRFHRTRFTQTRAGDRQSRQCPVIVPTPSSLAAPAGHCPWVHSALALPCQVLPQKTTPADLGSSTGGARASAGDVVLGRLLLAAGSELGSRHGRYPRWVAGHDECSYVHTSRSRFHDEPADTDSGVNPVAYRLTRRPAGPSGLPPVPSPVEPRARRCDDCPFNLSTNHHQHRAHLCPPPPTP